MTSTVPEGADRPSQQPRRLVGFVLPVFNELGNLPRLHEELHAVAAARPDLDFEFLCVDDGSTDGSRDLLLELRERDPRVSVLALSRNFGHQMAITAGMDASTAADAVILMDADLQDPPAVSLDLITAWEAGADVVYAQRRTRQDRGSKKLTAYLYYWLLARTASGDIPRNVGDFRLLDRRVVTEVGRYREHDRFLRGIVANVGFRQEAVAFDRDPRYSGTTHYTWRSMFKLAADGLLGFSTAPLRWISRSGLIVSALSVLLAVYVAYIRIFHPSDSVPGWAFLGVGLFLVSGLQLLMMGVIGSYLGRVYVETQDRPLYSVGMMARSPRGTPPAGDPR